MGRTSSGQEPTARISRRAEMAHPHLGKAGGSSPEDKIKGDKDFNEDNFVDLSRPADDDVVTDAIQKYSFSDGKKAVSVYVELDGLDAVADAHIRVDVSPGGREASLIIDGVGAPPKRRRLVLKRLLQEVASAKFTRKMGRNTVVLKL